MRSGFARKRLAPLPPKKTRWWESKNLHRVGAVLALIAASGAEYYLINSPEGEIGDSRVNPITVSAGEERVVVSAPVVDAKGLRVIPEALSPALLDVELDSARLSEKSAALLQGLGVRLPDAASGFYYSTSSKKHGSCQTTLVLQSGSPQPKQLEWSQPADVQPTDLRSLQIRFPEDEAVATITSGAGFEGERSPCEIRLRAGEFAQNMQGVMPLTFTVRAGSAIRLHWQKIGGGTLQKDGDTRPPFSLRFGHEQLPTLRASKVEVLGSARSVPRLSAMANRRDHLTISDLSVDTGALAFKLSGHGRLEQDGKTINTTNLLEKVNQNPILSALFGSLNVAILGWFTRAFFASKKE